VRILIAGAGGVLGRATLPHLSGHVIVPLTRADADVYDRDAVLAFAREARPETVVNFLTALREGAEANNRIRREAAPNLLHAAEAVGATRLVVESVAFALRGGAAAAVEELERETLRFRGDTLLIRFGRFWGPDTLHASEPEPPAIHIAQAGDEAAKLIAGGAAGTYTLATRPT
jgi:nucleoside-diphosphate-sugar epimerase